MEKYPRITIRLGADLLQQLEALAKEYHCSVGAVVRTALKWYLVEVLAKGQ